MISFSFEGGGYPFWKKSFLLLLYFLTGCTGPSKPEVIKNPEFSFDEQQQIKRVASIAGDNLNTLWRLEAQYLDDGGKPLSTSKVEVLLVAGEWRLELAPITSTPGWTAFRDPGEFGDGALDLIYLRQSGANPFYMRATQRITPLNQTEPIPVPPGAKGLRARLIEKCPIEVRYMRQFNRRPTGDVITIRTVKEEMRWREFRINGPCYQPSTTSYDF